MIEYIFYKDEYMFSSLGVYSRKQKGLKAGLSCLPKGLGSQWPPSFMTVHCPLVTRMCHYNFVTFLENWSSLYLQVRLECN